MNEAEIKPPSIFAACLAAIFVFVLWGGNYWGLSYWFGNGDGLAKAGQFGDQFGAVNALFSGLALVGLVYAILLQRYETKIAKEELKNAHKIFNDQKESLRLQNDQTKIQIFENTYFQLLSIFTELTNQIDITKGQNTTKGKDVFPIFLKRFKLKYNPPEKTIYGGHDFDSSYNDFYREHNTELGHYFRMLYNIVSFANDSDVKNKKFYIKILRAQLSDAEVEVLFYNCLSSYGKEKFKPLVEKWGLLKNLNENNVVDAKLIENYERSAFGKLR